MDENPPASDSTSLVVANARAGRLREQLPTLVDKHQRNLLAFVMGRGGTREQAEDVVQELWTKIASGDVGNFDGEPSRAWLFRVAHNQFISLARRLNHQRPLPDDFDPADDLSFGVDDETLAALQSCLEMHPEAARLLQAQCGGASYDEISAAEGIALGTVASRISRAKARLRDCVESQLS